jgi:hypothetical protein
MIFVEAAAYFEHVQVIKCDIKLGSIERSRDIENEENHKGVPLGTPFSNSVVTFSIFLKAIDAIFGTKFVINMGKLQLKVITCIFVIFFPI